MSGPDILIQSRAGNVVTLVLNRPEKMNALNRDLIDRLTRAIRDLSDDVETRAIILTGAGRAFCAGVDLKELSQADDVASSLEWEGANSLLNVVRACPHPILAAVNGFAVTGGLELALMADFIIASDTARFADTHARVGITPSWGMTQVLPRLIGLNRARQMSLTGEYVDAALAERWGLVNEVVAADTLLERCNELAQQIAETDATTMRRIRGLLQQSADWPLSVGLDQEATLFNQHIATVSGDAVAKRRKDVTDRGRNINKRSVS